MTSEWTTGSPLGRKLAWEQLLRQITAMESKQAQRCSSVSTHRRSHLNVNDPILIKLHRTMFGVNFNRYFSLWSRNVSYPCPISQKLIIYERVLTFIKFWVVEEVCGTTSGTRRSLVRRENIDDLFDKREDQMSYRIVADPNSFVKH